MAIPRYPSIPEPTLEPTSLRDSILAIKQLLEVLTGQRGNPDYAAVMPKDVLSNSGGTVNGVVTIGGNPAAALVLDAPIDNQIWGKQNNVPRWLIRPGNDAAETGSNTGSDFDMHRYADDGSYLNQVLNINRATGLWSINGNISTIGSINVNGAVTAAGDVSTYRPGSPATGAVFFGTSGAQYLYYAGSRFEFSKDVYIPNGLTVNGGQIASVVPNLTFNLFLQESTGGWRKGIRVVNGGDLQFINNANTSVIASLNDVGALILNNQCYVGGPASGPYSVAQCVTFIGGGTQFGMTMRALNDNTTAIAFINQSAGVSGSITMTAAAVAYNTSSDIRLKEDFKPFDAGEIIDQIEVHDFKWKDSGERGHGIAAQDVHEIYPEAVTHEEIADWWGVDYSKFVPLLLREVKALRERIKALETK